MQQCGTQRRRHAEPARRRPAALHADERQHLSRRGSSADGRRDAQRRRPTAAPIIDFVRANAVDTFDGKPVNFQSTFFNTISPDRRQAPTIRASWPCSTSRSGARRPATPAYDPSNHNFIYQRFQRGIMHYDAGCGCTQGLLLADYLKSAADRRQPARRPGRAGRRAARCCARPTNWPRARRDRLRRRVRPRAPAARLATRARRGHRLRTTPGASCRYRLALDRAPVVTRTHRRRPCPAPTTA